MTANEKFEKVMHEYGKGKLYSGKHKVTHPDQALAIAFSEAKKINPKFGIPKKNVGGLFSEQIGITDEEAIFWWDEVLSEKKKIEFVDYALSTIKDPKDPDFYLRRKDYLILTETKYKEFPVEIRNQIKTWLYSVPSKELKAEQGMKLVGPSHEDGGIPGKIKESDQPIEVEGGEVIINKRSMKIKEHITCKGTPEGIASRINEIDGNGIKFSDQPGKCQIMEIETEEKYFKKGDKITERTTLNEDEKQFIREEKGLPDYNYRPKILMGQPILLKETKDRTPIKKWYFENYEIAKKIAEKLNKENSKIRMKNGDKIRDHVGPSKVERMIIRDNELVKKAEEGIKVSDEYIKINEPEVFEIVKFVNNENPLSNENYIKELHKFNWKGNDVCIYRKTDNLKSFLDKYGIHHVVFESKEELDTYLKSLIPDRRKKQLELI